MCVCLGKNVVAFRLQHNFPLKLQLFLPIVGHWFFGTKQPTNVNGQNGYV